MLRIVSRYIMREVGQTWLAVTTVLVVVMFANRLIRYLGDAASGQLPGGIILTLMGYKALTFLSLVIPASFFLAIVLAMGRLYRDNEMAALVACGIGPRDLYKALMPVAVALTLLVAVLSFYIGPWAEGQGRVAELKAQENVELQGVRAGRFLQSDRANGMFYVESLGGTDNLMHGVYLQTEQKGKQILVTARSGKRDVDPATGDQFLVLYDGRRYDGVPGQSQWKIMQFRKHGVRIAQGDAKVVNIKRRGMSTAKLLAMDSTQAWAEIQWRIALPMMTLLLAFVAVPLSKSSPREGRYGRLIGAVVVYAAYSNALSLVKQLLEDGKVPMDVGLWPVHLAVLAAGVAWLVMQYGWPRRHRAGERA